MKRMFVYTIAILLIATTACERTRNAVVIPDPPDITHYAYDLPVISEQRLRDALRLLENNIPGICGEVIQVTFSCPSEQVCAQMPVWIEKSSYVGKDSELSPPTLFVVPPRHPMPQVVVPGVKKRVEYLYQTTFRFVCN